jgi:uncharacterized protein (DUF305 family)
MNRENIMVGIIGLLLGILVAGFAAGQAVNRNNAGMMRMMGMDTDNSQQETARSHDTMSMADMSKQLEDFTGDDYDKAFIETMIDHHEGAVSMAKFSDTRAKHEEVKQLSKDIITAQEKEIAEMRRWQQDWGYTSDEMMEMMHGSH